MSSNGTLAEGLNAGIRGLSPEALDALRERFLARTAMTENGCREWQGNLNSGGYGRVTVNGKFYLAHRLAWLLFRGPIPDGLWILHACDNPRCVAFDSHLRVGTAQENANDMVARSRHRSPNRGGVSPNAGERHYKTKLAERDVIVMRRLARIFKVTAGRAADAHHMRLGMGSAGLAQAIAGSTWSHLPGGLDPRHHQRWLDNRDWYAAGCPDNFWDDEEDDEMEALP